MQVWVNILNASGRILGDQLYLVNGYSVGRALDGMGSVRFNAPLGDVRARELVQHLRRMDIYAMPAGGQRRLIGRGIITDIESSVSDADKTLAVSGTDTLKELKDAVTLPGLNFNNRPIAQIAQELAGMAGWSASVAAGLGSTTINFPSQPVLKALQTFVEQNGIHFRLSGENRVIEVGAFGAELDLTIMGAEYLFPDALRNDQIALAERIVVQSTSAATVNWILPQGADGLTLAQSTRSDPYPRLSGTAPDGSTYHYIQNNNSVAENGRIADTPRYTNIVPASAAPQDVINAANALYDAALADLTRKSQVQVVYRATLRKVRQTIRPGDAVRVLYADPDLRVTGLFYVLRVSEAGGLEGSTVDLELSNVDRFPMTAERKLVSTIETVQELNMRN